MKRMMRSGLGINATMVANEFIDRYMAGANGEYVKVYLYLLRHQSEALDIGAIADALNHTESDVRRALGYWGRPAARREPRRGHGQAGCREPGRSHGQAAFRERRRGSRQADRRERCSGCRQTEYQGRRPGSRQERNR